MGLLASELAVKQVLHGEITSGIDKSKSLTP